MARFITRTRPSASLTTMGKGEFSTMIELRARLRRASSWASTRSVMSREINMMPPMRPSFSRQGLAFQLIQRTSPLGSRSSSGSPRSDSPASTRLWAALNFSVSGAAS